MKLSEKIYQLRKTNGLSQDELAERLNVSRQAISKWESEQSTPELDNILKIAEVFHVTTDFLLQADPTDELTLKTAILEKQQKEILSSQQKVLNRQYLIISIIVAGITILINFFIGKYVMFPDYGEGYTFLGKALIFCGTLVIIGATIILNWRYRNRQLQS